MDALNSQSLWLRQTRDLVLRPRVSEIVKEGVLLIRCEVYFRLDLAADFWQVKRRRQFGEG